MTNPNAALDAAGLAFTPVSGTFELMVHSKGDAKSHVQTTTNQHRAEWAGRGHDARQPGRAARCGRRHLSEHDGRPGSFSIASDSPDIEFAFPGDTSGVLAALGLNTFFTGSTAATIGVNDEVKGIDNAGKFAASLRWHRAGLGERRADCRRFWISRSNRPTALRSATCTTS